MNDGCENARVLAGRSMMYKMNKPQSLELMMVKVQGCFYSKFSVLFLFTFRFLANITYEFTLLLNCSRVHLQANF